MQHKNSQKPSPNPFETTTPTVSVVQIPMESNLQLLIPPRLKNYMLAVAEQAVSPSQPETLLKTWHGMILKNGVPPLLIALFANYAVSLPLAMKLGRMCEDNNTSNALTALLTWSLPTLSWHSTFVGLLFSYEHFRSLRSTNHSEVLPYIKEKLPFYLKLSVALEATWLLGLVAFQNFFYGLGYSKALAIPLANFGWSVPFNFFIIPFYFAAQKSGVSKVASALLDATKWTFKKWTAGFAGASIFRKESNAIRKSDKNSTAGILRDPVGLET